MSLDRLDEFDVRILQLLQQDGTRNISALANLIGLSRTPVARRIEKLEEQGYILNRTIVIDREKVGRPVLVILHVKLEKQTTDLLNEFECKVKELIQVQFCLHVA